MKKGTAAVTAAFCALLVIGCASHPDAIIARGGAVVGTAAGAIGGNADSGAGYGAIWGATRSTLDGDREKQMVFKRCLRGRGYRVLN